MYQNITMWHLNSSPWILKYNMMLWLEHAKRANKIKNNGSFTRQTKRKIIKQVWEDKINES